MAQLPVPVLADGELEASNFRGWWPGDPLPDHLYRQGDPRRYVLNRARDTYVLAPPAPPPANSVAGDIGAAIYVAVLIAVMGTLALMMWYLVIPVAVIVVLLKLTRRKG